MLWSKIIGAGGAGGGAWNVSTAVFNQSFSVAAQENQPSCVFFKPDGLKMYVVGFTGDDVNEYNLSTAWDISTAVFFQNFSVAGQDTEPRGVFFKPDGLKMYIMGNRFDRVVEYNLSTAWNVSTAVFLQLFSVAAQDTTPTGIYFRPDGLKMYVVGVVGLDVNEYNLSTAWNVSTAVFSQNFSIADRTSFPSGVFFKPDGLKMYVNGSASILEYDLSSAWDISTAEFLQDFSLAALPPNPSSLFFRDDGTKVYTVTNAFTAPTEPGDAVQEFDIG